MKNGHGLKKTSNTELAKNKRAMPILTLNDFGPYRFLALTILGLIKISKKRTH
jgi:hypothetical protein